jgi:hypothetical protein
MKCGSLGGTVGERIRLPQPKLPQFELLQFELRQVDRLEAML